MVHGNLLQVLFQLEKCFEHIWSGSLWSILQGTTVLYFVRQVLLNVMVIVFVKVVLCQIHSIAIL